VYHKNVFSFILTMIFCSGCGGNIANVFTATPDFVTATLSFTLTPQTAQTSTLPAPIPSVDEESIASPVEGTTTTQVNVRAGPSTASQSLGMIGPFVKVQVIGRDANGNWYQIIYGESESGKGWVRAEYAQVNVPAEIPLVETTAGSGSVVSGLVIQKINVRSGPSTEYQLLGELNSNDVVSITGKDTGSTWIQIEFANAPDGKGWVTAEFLQIGNIDTVPLIRNASNETATPTNATSAPIAAVTSAIQDGDSMRAPLAVVLFSPTGSRALQLSGDISTLGGDAEDWIQFTTAGKIVAIEVTCPSNSLRGELWKDEKPMDNLFFSCGKRSFVAVAANSRYFLRLSESSANEAGYTNYILSLESIR
jgi:uncharacterized protein YraI